MIAGVVDVTENHVITGLQALLHLHFSKLIEMHV